MFDGHQVALTCLFFLPVTEKIIAPQHFNHSAFSFLCRLCFFLDFFFFFFEWSRSVLRASDVVGSLLEDLERFLLLCLCRRFFRLRCSEWWRPPSDALGEEDRDELLLDVVEDDEEEEEDDEDDLRRRFLLLDEEASAVAVPDVEAAARSAMMRSRFLRSSSSNLLFKCSSQAASVLDPCFFFSMICFTSSQVGRLRLR